MFLLKAIFLGAVQGITEFLPVSSTGHLIIFEKVLGISQQTYGLAFDASIHLGTLFAVFWFFQREWQDLLQGLIKVTTGQPLEVLTKRLIICLVIGTLPAVVAGLVLENYLNQLFRSSVLVAISLIVFSLVFIYAEKFSRKNIDLSRLNKTDALIIGLFQSIALIPGVSRSGITIVGGMFRGLTRAQATKFAFLLSAPIVAGAGGKKLLEAGSLFVTQQLTSAELVFFLAGMIASAIFGYLTIKYFLKYIANHSLIPFIIYRLILGSVILVYYFLLI